MDTLQFAVTTALFGLLGAATTYRWLGHTGRAAEGSRKRIGLQTLSGALVWAGGWALLYSGLEILPDRWARAAPYVVLIGLALAYLRKPPRVTDAERQSRRRIQAAIMIGGVILAALCLIVYAWGRK